MSTKPTLLLLGSGPRVGASVAFSFASLNYNVAIASRTIPASLPSTYLHLPADFTIPSVIPSLFAAVYKHFNTYPTVVVYNAAALTPPSDANSVLSIPEERVRQDLNVNVVSAYVAAQEAVLGWKKMGDGVKGTFIYTGNASNDVITPFPMVFNLGMGKCASAYWVGFADMSYARSGYRFFYADERTEEGKIKGMALDGPAHGEFYPMLASHEGNIPWQATFVKGKGYVSFKK